MTVAALGPSAVAVAVGYLTVALGSGHDEGATKAAGTAWSTTKYSNLPPESSQFSLTPPTKLDKIKNLRIAVQAGGVVKGFTPTRRAKACHVGRGRARPKL